MSEIRSTFVALCASGNVIYDEIDDFVQTWHESENEEELHDFLGMAWNEYAAWVARPEILPFIITAHKEGRGLEEVLDEWETLPLAARAVDVEEAKNVMLWLRDHGKLE